MEPARIAELLQPFLSPLIDDCHSERSEESAVSSNGENADSSRQKAALGLTIGWI
jgi:hypothetical protein